MTTTLMDRGVQRVSFRDVAAQLRSNAGIDRADDVAAVRPVAAFGAAARRLRASNSFEPGTVVESDSTRLATVVTSSAGRLRAHARNRDVAADDDLEHRVGALAGRAPDLLATIEAVKTGKPKRVPRSMRVTQIERVERVVHVERVQRVVRVERVVRSAAATKSATDAAMSEVQVVAIVPLEGRVPTLGAVPSAPAGRVAAAAAYTVSGPLANTAQFGAAARRLRAAYDADLQDRFTISFTF